MIGLDPNSTSCIFSTLNYLCDKAKEYSVTPVITFDQPLFHPAALFDHSALPWEANKPALAGALWKQAKIENEELLQCLMEGL